jgi:SAM-dependent methyltransferase
MPLFNKAILPLEGDSLMINAEDKSFDVIIAREVVSHVRDLDTFLKEVNRVLKKKGVFFIKDDNNAFDIRGRIFRRKLWKECEFESKNPAGYRKSYRAMREDMLKDKYPQMNVKDLQILAEKTAGRWGQEIYRAADVFLKDNIWPLPAKFKYRNPETGEFPELEFNPYYLKRLLKELGYKARVIRPFYSYTYSGLKGILLNTIGKMISLFYPVSLFVAPTFEIIAEKNNC